MGEYRKTIDRIELKVTMRIVLRADKKADRSIARYIIKRISILFKNGFKLIVLLTISLMLCSCSVAPPKNIDNVCAMFDEYYDWYRAAKDVSRRYKIPESVTMAFIHQESKFISNNRPPRKWYLGFIPGPRPSSAYGYAQALDGTWKEYKRKTGRWSADRDDFDDAVDFIGWYNRQSIKRIGLPAHDAYSLYLAYHEGAGGFIRGTYKKKAWLKKVAAKVQRRANMYQQQLVSCRKELDNPGIWKRLFGHSSSMDAGQA